MGIFYFSLPPIHHFSSFSHFWAPIPPRVSQDFWAHPRVLRASPGATPAAPRPPITPQNLMGPRFRPAAAAGSAPEMFGEPELQQTGPDCHMEGQKGTKRDMETIPKLAQIWGTGSSRCWGFVPGTCPRKCQGSS